MQQIIKMFRPAFILKWDKNPRCPQIIECVSSVAHVMTLEGVELSLKKFSTVMKTVEALVLISRCLVNNALFAQINPK